jgi:hypothetical protein
MKNSIKITFGTILLAGIGVFTINQSDLQKSKLTNYSPRTNSLNITAKSAAGMMDFYKKMRANVNTGQIEAGDYNNAFSTVMNFNRNASRAATLQFIDEGPDNVGGRTRAILVDKNNINTIYAGSVSGGLFKSINRGNTWSRVYAFNTTLSVSTIAQTNSGTIYIGTGAEFESPISNGASGGHRANGVWYTTDGGATFQQLTPSTSFGSAGVNQIVADPIANDKIWIGGQFPIKLTSCENKTSFNAVSNLVTGVQDVQISKDGSVLIANQGSRTYVSTDFGASFTKVSGASAGQIKEISQSSISRTEYAIAHEKNNQGKYNIYAVQIKSVSLGVLAGISVSLDNGQTWTEVKPQTPNSLSAADALPSDPFSGGTQWQGNYDCIIEAIPNSNNFIVGGVRLFKYEMSTSSAPNGNFFEIASNQADETSSFYVHSDIHEFHFDNTGRLYIGSDGGISISDNINAGSPNYYVANRGYNTSQFYGIGYGRDGSLIGGCQDNSCVYKDVTASNTTALEFVTVSGGDGFDAEISNINPKVIFTSVQEGVIIRSPDKGTTNDFFVSSDMLGLPASFYTTMRLFENETDTNSTDSVYYYAQENKVAGETIMVASKNMSLLFPHLLTQNINVVYDSVFITTDTLILGTEYETGDTALLITARDTIRVQDRIQTLYATGLVGTGGVWVTREALRFGKTPVWWKVLDNAGSGVKSIEFSKDGNILYVGDFSGKVTRIKGFNNVYFNNEANDTINGVFDQDSLSYKYADVRSGVSQLDVQVIYNGGGGQAATGIAVDPKDPEHVVVTLGGYAGASHVIRSTTAGSTTGASSFTSIQGDLPNIPVYDAVIDVTSSNLIVVGTEFGIYASDNFGVNWTPQTNEAGIVPVFAMRQQWRPWDLANSNSGVIYAGTHGRGIWSSSTLLSIGDNTTIDKAKEVIAISVYPNPANQYTNISFDLTERADVNISVYNMQGKLVKANTVKNANKGSFKTQLNIDNLTKGTYFINIKAGNGKFKTAKFIKN